uniref:Uncharacterized protein n=1 Tax=Phytophthora ramorum TaxID=164328 RepID=H3GMY1_PHYRM
MRFCSSACVTKFFSSDSDSQELTPSSTSGISQSSTATVIDLAQREEEQEQEQEATDRIPDHIAHAPPMNSTDPIWDVIHQLEEAFTYKGKKFTHICLLCTESKTWKDSLCRASNSTNAKTHLVASHKDHEMAIQEQQRRLKRADRYMVQVNTRKNVKRLASSVRNSQEEQPIKRQKTWWKAPVIQEQISGHIARWLIRDGLPHNIVTTPAFRDFLVGVTGDPNVTVPAAKTYNEILDNHYDKFANDTSELFVEEFKELDETPFMTVEHDLWTNSSLSTMNGILGDSPFSRSSEEVADLLDEQLKARYGLDVRKMTRFTISDTAAAARKVSSQFDSTLQTDCAMHALNLCISYGIGLKENVRNEYMKDERTKLFVKKRVVVTQGGAFPEGGAVIRKLRNLNNFFASSKSPERIARLRDVQNFHKLPQLAALIDIDVRVASTIKLFRRSIINYPAFQAFFQNANVAKDQKNVFTCITCAEWELVAQMEAVMQRIAELALVESQSATMLSSTMYVLLRVASARMNSFKFSSYCLNGARDTDTNEMNFPRAPVTLPDLSQLTQRCIKRTLHQIAERLPLPSVPMGMALLLDPRTKTAAKNYLRIPDTSETATEYILEETKALLRIEHRVFYKGLHANADQGEGHVTSASSSPRGECNSSSDAEADLVYGEEVSQPAEESTADATLNAKADALLGEWLNLRVEWAEVVKKQYPSKDEFDKVLARLSRLIRKDRERFKAGLVAYTAQLAKLRSDLAASAKASVGAVPAQLQALQEENAILKRANSVLRRHSAAHDLDVDTLILASADD